MQLSIIVITSLLLCLLILGWFINEARRNKDFSTPKNMLAEFVAVFFAIAIGIIISGIERRSEQNLARDMIIEERKQLSRSLFLGAIEHIRSVLEVLEHDEISVTKQLVRDGNVVEVFLSNHWALESLGSSYSDIENAYTSLKTHDRAFLTFCNMSHELYLSQLTVRTGKRVAARWAVHSEDYEGDIDTIHLRGEEKRQRARALAQGHECVTRHQLWRTLSALDLLNVLCTQAQKSNLGVSCDWDKLGVPYDQRTPDASPLNESPGIDPRFWHFKDVRDDSPVLTKFIEIQSGLREIAGNTEEE